MRIPIHICSTLYRSEGVSPIHTVLIDGKYYAHVNKYLLQALKDGMSPEDLDMEPDEPEDFMTDEELEAHRHIEWMREQMRALR